MPQPKEFVNAPSGIRSDVQVILDDQGNLVITRQESFKSPQVAEIAANLAGAERLEVPLAPPEAEPREFFALQPAPVDGINSFKGNASLRQFRACQRQPLA